MKDTLVTPAKFARLTGQKHQYIYLLMTDKKAKIEPTIRGGVRFIDTAKYPPANFKKKNRDKN